MKHVPYSRTRLPIRNHAKEESLEEAFDDLRRDLELRIRDIQAEIGSGKTPAAVEESLDLVRDEFEQRLSSLRKQIDESVELEGRSSGKGRSPRPGPRLELVRSPEPSWGERAKSSTSFVYKAVQGVIDEVLDHMKEELDEYAKTAKQDLELFAHQLVRKAVKAMAVGVLGAVMVSVGVIFSLIGLVKYLSKLLTNPALAWGIVGLGMVGVGAVLLFTLTRHGPRAMKPDRPLNGEDGEN